MSSLHNMVTLEIDGHEVTVPEGTSIMNAAMQLGIQIPKLCATDSLDPFGSCRLCLCEIEGRRGTPASCTTLVAPGIKVATQNERLAKLRKGVMELYISDHPLDCLTCAANGDCELQDMAGAVGLREVRYGYEGDNHVFAKHHDGTINERYKAKDDIQPVFPVRSVKVHRLLALRTGLRRGPGHLRADHRRPRFCLARLGRHG
jgi:formate dehydrogenase major subunit